MDDDRFNEIAGFISRWACCITTAGCIIVALFFNSGYWFFVPFLTLITVALFREYRIEYQEEDDEL